MKPNLWLLVNPNIACPIQYRENAADTTFEPAEDIKTTPLLQHPPTADLHVFTHQQEVLQPVRSSQFTVRARV